MQLKNLKIKIAIYSPNWIGDAVMALPFIQELKIQNPKALLYVVCKNWVSGVYKNHSAINHIIPIRSYNLRGFKNTIKTGLKLRSEKFDLFFTLTDSFRSALILKLSGAKIRIGYNGQMRSYFLTSAIQKPVEMIHRSRAFLNLLGSEKSVLKLPRIYLSSSEKEWAKKEMKTLELDKPIAILPFSVGEGRTLPNDVIKGWIKKTNKNYIVFGSKNDFEKGKKLISYCGNTLMKSICGKYSLRESIALIDLCNYTLATDSGMGHISAALGVATVSFFGKGNTKVTTPFGQKTQIIKHCNPCLGKLCKKENKEISCIKKISQKNVENAVTKLIEQ